MGTDRSSAEKFDLASKPAAPNSCVGDLLVDHRCPHRHQCKGRRQAETPFTCSVEEIFLETQHLSLTVKSLGEHKAESLPLATGKGRPVPKA